MAQNTPSLYRPEVHFFGVSLESSQLRKWENYHNRPDESILTVDYSNIGTSPGENLEDISIAVAQHYNKSEKNFVKQLANDIFSSNTINIKDAVLGVSDNQLKKIGFVESKSIDDNKIELSIKWTTTNSDLKPSISVLPEGTGFHELKKTSIKKLERQFPIQFSELYQHLPEPIGLHNSMQIPRIEKKWSEQFLETEAPIDDDDHKEDQGGIVTLFYGTNRQRVISKSKIFDYDSVETDNIKYGTCDVQIPIGHKQGELERPGKILWVIPEPENEHIHFVLKSAEEIEKDDFRTEISKRLVNAPEKQALLFVHGYRTTFKEAAYRTAQLTYDLKFKGVSGFFSWPSAGKLVPYPTDGAAARSSALYLKTFISEIIQINELEQLHIIAHSMGGLILTLSLKDLIADPTMIVHVDKIFQIILGAPDIDQKEFRNTLLPAFKKVGQRRTLYASDHDMALQFSSVGRGLRDRLGMVDGNIFVADSLDSIEVSNVKTTDKHGYMFRSKELLNDMFYLITQGLPPSKRRLREIIKQPVNYWLFPK